MNQRERDVNSSLTSATTRLTCFSSPQWNTMQHKPVSPCFFPNCSTGIVRECIKPSDDAFPCRTEISAGLHQAYPRCEYWQTDDFSQPAAEREQL